MTKVCILTDNTAQFPIPAFPGRKFLHIISLHIEFDGEYYEKSEDIRASHLPVSTRLGKTSKAIPPSVEEFESMFNQLGEQYEEIVAIFHSTHLSNTYENAKEALRSIQGNAKIELIDSQTTGTGLGLVVQAAAAAAEEGKSASEVEDMIRSLLPRVYSLFCLEGLTYLNRNGYLGDEQALVAEYMKMLPVYVLDSGHLVPTQKARNPRHLVDLLHEFISEFENLEHIGILQGIPAFENESRALRERISLDYDQVPISEHIIGSVLSTMIGPRSLGIFVLQAE